MSSGSGKHHGNGANSKRTERKRNRYRSNLLLRISKLNKLAKQRPLTDAEQRLLHKMEQMLDSPRKRAVSSRHNKNRDAAVGRRLNSVPNYQHDEHGHRIGKPFIVTEVKGQKRLVLTTRAV